MCTRSSEHSRSWPSTSPLVRVQLTETAHVGPSAAAKIQDLVREHPTQFTATEVGYGFEPTIKVETSSATMAYAIRRKMYPRGDKPSSFFMVMSDDASRPPPRVRHADSMKAETEATRLAKLHPGTSFYVLEARSEFVMTGVARRELA